MVHLDGFFHQVVQGVGIQVALRDHHQAQRVTNHLDDRVVFGQLGEFAKNRAGVGVFHVGFEGHHAFFFHHGLQFANQQHQGQVVGLVPLGALDALADATHRGLEHRKTVGHQRSADGRAPDDDEFERCGLDDGGHLAASEDVPAKNRAKHNR